VIYLRINGRRLMCSRLFSRVTTKTKTTGMKAQNWVEETKKTRRRWWEEGALQVQQLFWMTSPVDPETFKPRFVPRKGGKDKERKKDQGKETRSQRGEKGQEREKEEGKGER
jgi:hypothetical protein